MTSGNLPGGPAGRGRVTFGGNTLAASVAARGRDQGFALMRERRFDEAVVALREALSADAADAAAWCALGDALHAAGRLDEGCEAYRASVSLDGNRFAAWWGLGCAQAGRSEDALAAEAMQRAVVLRSQHAPAWHNLGKALYKLGRIEDAIDAMRRAAELDPRSPLPLGNLAMAIPGDPRADGAAVLAARRAWARHGLAGIAPATLGPHRGGSEPRRLRIGYLSAFFEHRNWMKPVWTLINRHDRERFEVHLLSDCPREAIVHGYSERPEDRFVELTGLGNTEAAARIAALDLDLLVDLNAYSAPARLGAVAARPARRVVGWFNTFAPTGLEAYDAVIGDEIVASAADAASFDEPIVRVPGSWLTFEVTYPVPDVAPPPSLERGHLTFGCMAPLYKIGPSVVQALGRILAGCPGSRLLLKSAALEAPATRAFVERQFAAHGVAADALILEGPVEYDQFLEAYGQIDVALDTFPYSGGTTTTDALWQGVPVLSISGDRWAARLGASLMHYAGLDAFVLPDVESFVGRAIALYRDPGTPHQLASLRASMRERLRRSPACDAQAFAKAMEQAYVDVIQAPPRRR